MIGHADRKRSLLWRPAAVIGLGVLSRGRESSEHRRSVVHHEGCKIWDAISRSQTLSAGTTLVTGAS